MKTLLGAAALAMITGQVHALSCLRPDAVETFQRLAAAEESYFVLFGELTFDEARLPASASNDQTRPSTVIPAQFAGNSLTARGFTNAYSRDVNLQITCAGQWCGSAQSGIDAVYFVPSGETPATLTAGPCGGMLFPEPTQAVLDMLTSCMAGGPCSAQPLQ